MIFFSEGKESGRQESHGGLGGSGGTIPQEGRPKGRGSRVTSRGAVSKSVPRALRCEHSPESSHLSSKLKRLKWDRFPAGTRS